jgi:8-hydroxy-5-deazaflavin:NADPH oxidoreductase
VASDSHEIKCLPLPGVHSSPNLEGTPIGFTVVPKTLREAIKADMIILAVPFWEHREVAKTLASWQGKTIIDAMNVLVPVEDLSGLPSSAVVAKAFPGARL